MLFGCLKLFSCVLTHFLFMFQAAHPDRYIECFIAEQNLVGVAIGCGTRGRTVPFCSTFAAFFTRAFDQIRMGAISQTNCNFAGSHAGISIGEFLHSFANFQTKKYRYFSYFSTKAYVEGAH